MNFVEECFEMLQYIEKGNKLKWSYFPKVGNTVMVYLSAVLNYLDVGEYTCAYLKDGRYPIITMQPKVRFIY